MTDEEASYLYIKNKFITDYYNGDTRFYDLPRVLLEDYDIAMLVVESSPLELENFSIELKNSYNICHTAVSQDGRALEYVDPELQKNMELVQVAVWSNIEALYFVDEDLKKSDEFLTYLETFIEQKDFKQLFPEIYNDVCFRKTAREHAEKLNSLLVEKDEKKPLRHKI